MACFTFNSLQHGNIISLTCSSFETKLVRKSLVEAHTSSANLGALEHEPSAKSTRLRDRKETGRVDPLVERVLKNSGKNHANSVVEEKSEKKFSRVTRKTSGYRERRGISSRRSPRDDTRGGKSLEASGNVVVNEKRVKKYHENMVGRGNEEKKPKKDKDSPEVKLRGGLDMCSKRGDVMKALSLYDSARMEGVKLGQHHYTVLLYLCSSSAAGVVQPAKSGSGTRTLNALASSSEVVGILDSPVSANGRLIGPFKSSGTVDNSRVYVQNSMCTSIDKNKTKFSKDLLTQSTLQDDDEFFPYEDVASNQEEHSILVSDDVKKYALQRGFEIYEDMCKDKVQINEAALTSVARMAMSMGDGDMALEMVKQMKTLGINPRLRSYGPALSTFCNNGDIDKAFAVEKHMLEHGICPEEPELEALLRVSVEAGKGEKVYYLLHKLRTNVRKVSPSTADLIIDWFNSKQASRLGKRKWDKRLIKEAMKNNGGGWHGQGWLGKGKWNVSNTTTGTDGVCNCCGMQLATIDLDPIETEDFAKSVASIAIMREKRSNFEKFRKWLDYYGPFEAVVDAANVGLYSQKRFIPSKINAVVNGIRHKLPSKKFPLIILHNKRVTGNKMDEPINRALVEKWKNSDALYATPTGSNDDWYWLYAAIKFKCLLVTNDEMRDHIFQLLGNDFFPKWKERHQVHFSFSDTGPEFHMPPPCSVVIQESEEGHWHIPVESDHDIESERRWLCITRSKPDKVWQNSSTSEDLGVVQDMESARSANLAESTNNMLHLNHDKIGDKPQEMYKNLRDILSASISSDHSTLLSEIQAAELIGGCTIDFQI